MVHDTVVSLVFRFGSAVVAMSVVSDSDRRFAADCQRINPGCSWCGRRTGNFCDECAASVVHVTHYEEHGAFAVCSSCEQNYEFTMGTCKACFYEDVSERWPSVRSDIFIDTLG